MWTYPTGEPHWLETEFPERHGWHSPRGLGKAVVWESYVHMLWSHHRDVFNYFDDWVLIQANEDNTEIRDIVLHKKERQHTETIAWGKR